MVLRTDENGDIGIVASGRGITIADR
jgi:hypothetical protein